MQVAYEDLGHGTPTAARQHLGTQLGTHLDVDFLNRNALRREQAPRPAAVGACVHDIHDNLRRAHTGLGAMALQPLASGRLSVRQAASPPRRLNTFVKPCAASWRTAAAASGPDSSYTTMGFSFCFLSVSPAVAIWSDGMLRAPLTWPAANASCGRMSRTSALWFMSRMTSC